VVPVGLAVVVGAIVLRPTPSRVTHDNYNRLRRGMTPRAGRSDPRATGRLFDWSDRTHVGRVAEGRPRLAELYRTEVVKRSGEDHRPPLRAKRQWHRWFPE
jgi:hypothetical protein